ncbi:cellulose 1,4-beta-cellobiosidase [Kitasatospora sp. MMS16-BH015]|uniref:glycoside hydrolase family 48 protein n=1 Tax=Kitasatospora sp. MMS16-BH015 TaxID=2018025 RepID=UPI000CA3E226|nr:glycoside hydrolase family 48 protein [Kitasatospora sp. MMS16-BH015]AUG81854.1 cellulose 1,4-beta-cellobiosidase [Kitasatospora sp. MMS16-BH015]
MRRTARRSRDRRLTVTATATVLALLGAAGGALSAPAAEAAAGVSCNVSYALGNDWGSGFTANLTITDTGTTPINGWTLGYAYTGNQTLQNGWNGTWTQTGKNVTVTSPSWAATINPGTSYTTSANFGYSGTNTAPTTFTVNGTTCHGANQAPTVSLTSPTAGQTFTPGSTVKLAADAADADGTVSKVDFYASTSAGSNTLIGSTTTAPYGASWANVPAGDYSLTAVATDNSGATTTSSPVAIKVSGPTLLVSPATLAVQQGSTGTFTVALSQAPAADTTVTVARSGSDTDLSVKSGGTLTFTTANWSTPQTVTVAAGTDAAQVGGTATFTASATGFGSAAVAVTEAAKSSGYDQYFLDLYSKMKNPANGYFSPQGIPYHSVETLVVEAPDYGHETTSETYSYWLWLEADYGRVTGDWTAFNNAWTSLETYLIPSHAQQPGQSTYSPSKPATYGPEKAQPDQYPIKLNSGVPVGSDPLAAELSSTYGTSDLYSPAWLLDTDNRYGFGQCEDGTTKPSLINTFQRGPEESVWETVPQPDCDVMKYGSPGSGFLSLFNDGGGSFSKQYKYTDAPDADARLVQAAYWAEQFAKAQGKSAAITATLGKAAKLGDYLRYSLYDKYFKQAGNCLGSTACPAGSSKANEQLGLLTWYFAWGGDTGGAWSWRVSGSAAHQGYQNPMAAWVLANDPGLKPSSPTASTDWAGSLDKQLQFFQWLQSGEGGIAGGATNSWGGNYGDDAAPPAGDPTFYGLYYDWRPEYHDPASNQWFGFQTWSMERFAEYYNATGDARAKAILDKWVPWAMSVAKADPATGTLTTPDALTWTGAPDTWSATSPGANAGLHVTAAGGATDLGVAGSLAKTLAYYAAKSGSSTAQKFAQNILDTIHAKFADSLGYSAPETRTDFNRFTQPYSATTHQGLYVPSGWTGTYPDGTKINSSSTFLSIRPWYTSDPQWSKVQTYLDGGAAPTFNYHRFWAEADIATAFDTFAQLFPGVNPGS